MWQAAIDTINGQSRKRVTFSAGGQILTYGQVLALWSEESSEAARFRRHFNQTLGDMAYSAFLWETPPLRSDNLTRPFESMVIDCPALASMRPQPNAFGEHFDPAAPVAVFDNLGGDALLVAPGPDRPGASYPHLAAFCRSAPPDLQDLFWRRAGQAALARIGERPLWISTNGLGVAWLHLRLDSAPKYYSHQPYRRLG